ncbi:MAG: hypothetical protein SFU25_02170 [Candidatus Caenarcaniphilales bacterium]|nr:hypothetical protein [Candidatus Caenarcaniphilales bacterium]
MSFLENKLFTNRMASSLIKFGFLFIALSFTSACAVDKVKNDCLKFDKGFLEACNTNCPTKCTETASASKNINLSISKIKEMCKESCSKHCMVQLENVRPNQCKPKK